MLKPYAPSRTPRWLHHFPRCRRTLKSNRPSFGPEGNKKLGLDANGRNPRAGMTQETAGVGRVNGEAGVIYYDSASADTIFKNLK